MAYRLLNGMAPPYLNQLVSVPSLPGRRRLRSSFTLQLHVPLYQPAVARSLSQPLAYFLEHSERRRAVCTVCLFFPATAKDNPGSPVISGHQFKFPYYFATVV